MRRVDVDTSDNTEDDEIPVQGSKLYERVTPKEIAKIFFINNGKYRIQLYNIYQKEDHIIYFPIFNYDGDVTIEAYRTFSPYDTKISQSPVVMLIAPTEDLVAKQLKKLAIRTGRILYPDISTRLIVLGARQWYIFNDDLLDRIKQIILFSLVQKNRELVKELVEKVKSRLTRTLNMIGMSNEDVKHDDGEILGQTTVECDINSVCNNTRFDYEIIEDKLNMTTVSSWLTCKNPNVFSGVMNIVKILILLDTPEGRRKLITGEMFIDY